jgi:hypothetical protein
LEEQEGDADEGKASFRAERKNSASPGSQRCRETNIISNLTRMRDLTKKRFAYLEKTLFRNKNVNRKARKELNKVRTWLLWWSTNLVQNASIPTERIQDWRVRLSF